MTELSRRRFLTTAAATAAGIGTSLLPPSLLRAMATTPMRTGGLDAVEHVIVLMQENRSFDHYFGRLAGVRGYGDRHPLTLPDGRTIFAQPKVGGEVLPFSLREAAARENRDPSDIEYLNGLPHGFSDSTSAWAQGWNNNWIAAKGEAAMTYYDRLDIGLQYELADTFTICDAYYCSVFGSTNPNRNYLVSGTTGYEPGTTNRAVTNAAYSYSHAGYDWTTYPERLEAAGVTWQIYQEWDNFNDNAVEYFRPFKEIGRKILAHVNGTYRTTEEFYYALFGMPKKKQDQLLAQFAKGRAALTEAERRLFDRGAARSRPQTLISRVRADIAAGTLPAVSWLVPTAVDSEHPSTGTPVGSANLIYQLLDALGSYPETWAKTAVLINFDENDGFFDHVPQPVAPRPASGNGDDWYNGKPIGLGPRVPMTVVSPWSIGGHVCSETYDHTSVIRFLEQWTGVAEPNISDWRRQTCGDLTAAFDFTRPGTRPHVDQPGAVPKPITRWRPVPPVDQKLPEQEPGRRPARALPYRPSVSGAVEGGALVLRLDSTGTVPAPLAIYPYAAELPAPKHVVVTGAQTETLTVAGAYRLAVQGPNRFWHELAGTLTGAAAGVAVGNSASAGGLSLSLRNSGSAPVTLRFTARGYGDHTATVDLPAGAQQSLSWPTDQGWYDVEVSCEQDASYRRRLTGRVEDGNPGVTG